MIEEAFGEHDLYFHDASVYNTHLRVPVWIHQPEHSPEKIEDVVSMLGIFDLIREVGLGRGVKHTPLSHDYRAQRPFACSEHYYPHVRGARARYRKNLAGVVVGNRKIIARSDETLHYDLRRDPREQDPYPAPVEEIESTCTSANSLERTAICSRGTSHDLDD